MHPLHLDLAETHPGDGRGPGTQATGDKMRIVCPNCGAQYEIPDEVIPETGRDVQCSNCGETWFQPHPSHPAEPSAAPEDEAALTEQADWTEPDDSMADEAGTPPPERRQRLAPEVANVLREEAERESKARAAESGSALETQPDLGLTEGDDKTRSRQARERMDRLRGAASTDDEMASREDAQGIDPVSRRNLLPDIEEVDPALSRARQEEDDDMSARDGSRAATPAPARPGGFRTGFRLAVLLAILATAAYLLAPRIADAVPALAEPLARYVEAVNSWRAELNGLVADVAARFSPPGGG